jgi:hypothetical protein
MSKYAGLRFTSPTLAALLEEAVEGRCPLCDSRLLPYKGTGRRARWCWSADCRTEYMRIWKTDERRRLGLKERALSRDNH